MPKTLFLLIICMAVAVQSIPAPGHGGVCNNASHCNDDECCVSLLQPIGRKRSLSQLGMCSKLGTSGSWCDPSSLSGQPQAMVLECPCAPGFKCIPQGWSGGIVVPVLHEPGRCTSSGGN
ncbi:uncharacterized protein LOC112041494 [Lingula anatina]|uniref:Uncharacterized protein LOC106154001 n=1 Tax=Lingula anatina TaxID=7574 RepID=A0A1S3HCB0_LINAN|nr:uncharacterized protein LOC106154001 [Lingula anatina]XP_023930578.1 uncharacterized protein LOC112041494 [Lingula anatina]|eukprot:XP_013383648.1 uncharacterized protein LOC106154001 [Lingula anatina]